MPLVMATDSASSEVLPTRPTSSERPYSIAADETAPNSTYFMLASLAFRSERRMPTST